MWPVGFEQHMKSAAEETSSKQGAVFAKTIDSRLRQISTRHEGILENFDRTGKLAAGTKGSLDSTMMETMESTEQAWNKNV